MKAPFKMKAGKEGPMKKNFGIGSPVKDIKKSQMVKTKQKYYHLTTVEHGQKKELLGEIKMAKL